MSKRGWALFVALGVIWGMPYLLIRIAVGTIDRLVVAPLARRASRTTSSIRRAWRRVVEHALVSNKLRRSVEQRRLEENTDVERRIGRAL